MEEQTTPNNRPSNPRRRKRSKWDIIKESYLPLGIAALAVILVLVIIIGSITRAVQKNKAEELAAIAASNAQVALDDEASFIASQAAVLADEYDYEGAIALIDSFSGDINSYPELVQLRDQYAYEITQIYVWDDPSAILNLSFHSLVVDPERAFNFPGYGSSNQQHYLTTTEFDAILQQLYDNGYILVSFSDVYTVTTAEDGTSVFTAKTLRLPLGKKPIMITQTNVNYYTYLSDGDGDGIADKNGAGFATKMVVGADGRVDCEYIDASGEVLVGAYDLVPILDDFVDAHPDFSYRGAKATIAVSGYDGVFGYRTNKGAEEKFGTDVYNQEISDATAVAQALKNSGYEIACYTYNNIAYGSLSAEEMQEDINAWMEEVSPIVGDVNIMVYAQKSDIEDSLLYTGDKYQILHNLGFEYYLGVCEDGIPWTIIDDTYVRQTRIMVTGSNLMNNPQWFTDVFDASSVIEYSAR